MPAAECMVKDIDYKCAATIQDNTRATEIISVHIHQYLDPQ